MKGYENINMKLHASLCFVISFYLMLYYSYSLPIIVAQFVNYFASHIIISIFPSLASCYCPISLFTRDMHRVNYKILKIFYKVDGKEKTLDLY